jgi:heat shock protein HslJ
MEMKRARILSVGLVLAIVGVISACAAAGADQPSGPTPSGEPPSAPTDLPTNPPATPTLEPTDTPAEEPGPNDLAGTSWTLAEMNGSAPVAGTQITLTFQETDLGGMACNSYGGSYSASGGTLAVGEIVSTMMACTGPEGIMEQEAAYLAALGGATHYALSGGQLALGSDADPSALVFTAGAPEVSAVPEGWLTYQDEVYGFAVSYPESSAGSGGPVPMGDENSVRLDLPFTAGTNLQEKYLQIDAHTGSEVCTSPLTEGYAPGTIVPEPVMVSDLEWMKESGADAGAGNYYEFTAYSTTQGDTCVTLSFVLHSTAAQNYTPPLEEFDREAESAVFEEILGTFRWLP